MILLLRFLLFTAGIAGVLYLHFLLAHRAWRRSRGRPSLELNRGYLRMEDYFAQSFRLKVSEWLTNAGAKVTEPCEAATSRVGERLRSMERLELPAASAEDAVLVVNRDFSCGPACVFKGEIYARGEGRVGDRSRLQAIASDGTLTLGAGVTVGRWVDSEGDLEIGPECSIGGRVTSRGAVRLRRGARARSLFGRVVEVDSGAEVVALRPPPGPEEYLEIPPDDGARSVFASKKLEGFDSSSLAQLSSDTWMYRGDLRPPVPLQVRTKLIVKGDCHCPAGTILEDDVKVSGSLELGSGSVAKGNLIAGREISLGPYSRFEGVIHAGGSLRLGTGARGGRDGGRVAAFARSVVYVEENVTVANGKVASGEYVVAAVSEGAGRGQLKRGVA